MSKVKIIWVDDDINRSELRADKEELMERGCEIISIPNTDAFLEILKENQGNSDCDCIILDLSMPVGNEFKPEDAAYGSRTGLLLMKKIRENFIFHNVKIIVFTIVESEELEKECRKADALYLKKANLLSYEFADKVMAWINFKRN